MAGGAHAAEGDYLLMTMNYVLNSEMLKPDRKKRAP